MSGPEQPGYTGRVYLGVWTNWSHGPLNGLTLTLSHKNGAILTAFLVLLITYVGGRFWRVIRLVAHRFFSSDKPEDTFYHQRQVLLRNTNSSLAALVSLFQLSWAWRKRQKIHAFWRNSGVMLLAIINTTIFIAASLLSSKVANSMGDEVLISSPFCGALEESLPETEFQGVRELLHRQRRNLNVNYVDTCYGNNTDAARCAIYRQTKLSYNKTVNVACPFPGGDKICQNANGTIRLETGYINSNNDLGVNSKPEERHEWRTVLECSPLQTAKFISIENQQVGSDPPRQLATYSFGKSKKFGNATWQIPLEEPNISNETYRKTDYTLGIYAYKRDENGSISTKRSAFLPIPILERPDADGALSFLSSNDIPFLGEVNDPWFSARRFSGKTASETGYKAVENDEKLYFRDEPSQVVGCTQQWQICNPNQPKETGCTPLTSGEQARHLADPLWSSEAQRDLFKWAHVSFGFIPAAPWMGGHSLLAFLTLSAYFQARLSDNQWEQEMERFFQQGLAAMQRNKIERAAGYSDSSLRHLIVLAETAAQKEACSRQIVRSPGYTSFSVLGLSVILVLSVLITITSLAIPMILARSALKSNRKASYKSLEWSANSILQLQRLAHEAAGFGTWSKTNGEHPVTEIDEKLAVLEISNMKHPRLQSDLKLGE
jgi:hypothetical protein